MCSFDRKIWKIWPKVIFFGIMMFFYRTYHHYAWGYNFPIRTTPKKNFHF